MKAIISSTAAGWGPLDENLSNASFEILTRTREQSLEGVPQRSNRRRIRRPARRSPTMLIPRRVCVKSMMQNGGTVATSPAESAIIDNRSDPRVLMDDAVCPRPARDRRPPPILPAGAPPAIIVEFPTRQS